MSASANQPALGIWEVAVLALLREEPMHPYQMRRLLKARHKDEILALKHGSLYHAIRRLERDSLIAVEGTTREGRRPERTTYRLTSAGEETLLAMLRVLVAVPRRESSEFMAAMSFLVYLGPAEAATRLNQRIGALEAQIAAAESGLATASAFVERINLIENEYLITMLRAELEWTRSLFRDLSEGRLHWSLDEILRKATAEAGSGQARRETGKRFPDKEA